MRNGHAFTIDAQLRRKLNRATNLNQQELARQLDRKQPWINKFLKGHGQATIDDWIGIARYFSQTLDAFVQARSIPSTPSGEIVRSTAERQLLHAFRRIPPDAQLRQTAIDLLTTYARNARRLRTPGSPRRKQQTPPSTDRRVLDT